MSKRNNESQDEFQNLKIRLFSMIFPLTFQDDILTGKARGQWKTLGFVQPWACGVVKTAVASRDETEDHHPVWLRDQEVQVRLPNVICNREDDPGGVIA